MGGSTLDREPDEKSGDTQVDAPEFPSHIIFIGASAGGLDSIRKFFECMPVQTGYAFIIIQHLSPRFKSMMDDILARYTSIPIVPAQTGVSVEANKIYLTPPRSQIHFPHDKFRVEYDESNLIHPIDQAFESGAEAFGDRAIGVILSGTGSDGTKGVVSIHDAGGRVLIESEESAEFDGMPRSAFATDIVDLVAGAERLPQALLNLLEHPIANQDEALETLESLAEDNEIYQVLSLIKASQKVDFSQYRLSTIERRIDKRMINAHCENLTDYIEKLKKEEAEQEALYHDLLIGVTSFFRDSKVFESIEKVIIPELFKGKTAANEIRIWVAGCASGEEAYSYAILASEFASKMEAPPNIKIFATDVHRNSINKAAGGFFSDESVANIPKPHLNRYFKRENGSYRVIPDLRRMVVFAEHNILRDPPFTKIDLVSCRNMLIYFQPPAQRKALGLFLFSLKIQGYMILGASESPGALSNHLDMTFANLNIFRKENDVPSHPLIVLPNKTKADKVEPMHAQPLVRMAPVVPTENRFSELFEAMLGRCLPPSVLVNAKFEIIQTFGNCEHFLHPMSGRATWNVLQHVRIELRSTIKVALDDAITQKKPIKYENVGLRNNETIKTIDIVIEPQSEPYSKRLFYLIKFEPSTEEELEDEDMVVYRSKSQLADKNNEIRITELERELSLTRENLQATVEELETSNEELQATNEELMAANEELQSTNEELHSVNEELFTVNTEYERKNEELSQLNADINKLLSSTDIGTIFIDENLRIRKTTPKASEIFNLIEEDIGRPIEHVTHNFEDYTDFISDLNQVFRTGKPFEKELQDNKGNWILLRILPYRDSRETNLGALLTFVDITAVKEAELALRDNEVKLDLALQSVGLGIWNWKRSEKLIDGNDQFYDLLGLKKENAIDSETLLEHMNLLQASDASSKRQLTSDQQSKQETIQHSWVHRAQDGSLHHFAGRAMVTFDDEHNVAYQSGVIWDETEVKKHEKFVSQKKADLETLLYVISHDLKEPLRAIRNFSQFIDTQYNEKMDEKGRDYLSRIIRGAKRMETLLNDVLVLSRVQRMQEPTETVTGNAIVESVLNDLEEKIKETQAEVTVSRDLPDLRANPTWAQQAIYNLIANALKFISPDSTPQVTVMPYVSLESYDDHNGIVVMDRGPGVPEDSTDRIFKLFQRAVGRQVEGTGAGLAIVKQVAIMHGGDVTYEPREGGGSKFTLKFLK